MGDFKNNIVPLLFNKIKAWIVFSNFIYGNLENV